MPAHSAQNQEVFALTRLATALAALALCDSIVQDQPATTLPISPSANLPVMQSEHETTFGGGDAGMIWAPAAEETSIQQLRDGGGATAKPGPEVGVTGPCAPIAQRISHRREFLLAVEQKAIVVGPEQAMQILCEERPTEAECSRAPTSIERNLDELIVNDPNDQPEQDPWIVRWLRELSSCQVQHHATTRAPGRK